MSDVAETIAPVVETTGALSETKAPEAAPDAPEPKNAIERILHKRQAKEAAQAKTSEQPAADAAPATDGKQEGQGEKPAAAPEEKQLSLKHAQLKADHRKALAEKEQYKGERDTAVKERDAIKASFAKNPFVALEQITGRKFAELVQEAAGGKYDTKSELSPELQAKLDELDQWKRDQEAHKAKEQEALARREDEALASDFMAQHKDKYPLFALSGFAAQEIVDRAYAELKAGREVDLEAIAAQCEADSAKNLETLFRNTELLSVLAKRPQVRSSLMQAFGLSSDTAARPASSQQQGGSGPGNGPRTLSHTTTQESPVPPEHAPKGDDSWDIEEAKSRFAAFKQRGRVIG